MTVYSLTLRLCYCVDSEKNLKEVEGELLHCN